MPIQHIIVKLKINLFRDYLELNENGGEGGIRTLDRAINPILP